MKSFTFLLVAFSTLPCLAQSFEEEITQAKTDYNSVREQTGKLAEDRRFGEISELWLKAVPDKEKTAADYFLLGNVLFGPQPDKALELHRKAAELKPDEPQVQLEFAMSLHRNGKYAEAVAPYTAYLQSYPTSVINALLADCLIRQGQFKEGIVAWENAGSFLDRDRIAHYIFEIHGDRSTPQRHYDLLQQARKGDIQAAAKTILLDSNWDNDWWNTEVNSAFLATDIEEFAKLFPANDPTLLTMQAVANWNLGEQEDVRPLEESLRKAKVVLGDSAILPRPGLLASNLINVLLSKDVVAPEELLSKFEADFEKELVLPKEQIDQEVINVYANLLARTNNRAKLISVDRTMWKKTGDPRFSASYLVSLVGDGKGIDDPEVDAIIRQFPNHSAVCEIALNLAKSANRPLAPYLSNAIAAEFDLLSQNRLSMVRTPDRLNHLMHELEKEIEK